MLKAEGNAARLRALLETVHHTRVALVGLMSEAECDRPKCTGSSEYDWSVEDAARELLPELKRLGAYTREERIGRALADLQIAINAAWGEAIVQNVHGELVALWLKGGGKRSGRAWVPRAEAESEAVYVLRSLVASFNTERIRGTLKQYAYRPVMRWLALWSVRRHSPVALPRDIARETDPQMLIEVDEIENSSHGNSTEDRRRENGELDPLLVLFEETHGRSFDELTRERGR